MLKIFFFLLSSTIVFSQTIKGTVSSNGYILPYANVLIKKKVSPTVIFQYTTTNDKGNYQIDLLGNVEELSIEFTSVSHETKIINLLEYPIDKKIIKIDVSLNNTITNLKEIIVESKNAIRVKKDTVTYDPNAFKDGTEKVVEDILRKLPGVEVQDNGEIKFKGKSIKKLLLDGDDLFDSQYKIGSKNISADMIDKVQGIENYEVNTLLKGISASDEVALNLILKKGKTDFSGNANLGYGYSTNLDNTVSGILVNSKLKGFAVGSFNNIGQNNTPYDPETDFQSFDKDKSRYAKTIIDQGNFTSLLSDKFHRLNNNFFASANTLFKIKKKSSLKLNLGFYNDRLSRNNQSNTSFSTGNTNFSLFENNEFLKKPVLYDVKIYFNNKEKENFHWDYLGSLNFTNTNFTDHSNNNGILQQSRVQTESVFLQQTLNFTNKLSEHNVIVTKIDYSKSSAPQSLNINPGTAIDNTIFSFNQNSRFDNQFINLKSILYSKKRDSIHFAIATEYVNTSSKLSSALSDNQNNSIGSAYQNDNLYQINLFSVKPVLAIFKKNYSLKLKVNTLFNNVLYKSLLTNTFQENKFTVLPEIFLDFNISKKVALQTSYAYNAILPYDNQVFTGIVQTNYRGFSNNTVSLEFLKTHSYSLRYNYADLYNSRRISVSLNHDYRPNGYFSNTFINQNVTVNNSFFQTLDAKNYSLNLSSEFYLHPLRTTFQINGNYSIAFNKNIVNNSDIRDVKNNSMFLSLLGRVAVKSKITLENSLSFNQNISEVATNKIAFQSLTNRTQVIFKPSPQIKMFAISNIIKPNLAQNNNYLFLEYELNYTPVKSNYNYRIIAKNLTDNKTFETFNISDFSTTTNAHNIIRRYIMFQVAFSF